MIKDTNHIPDVIKGLNEFNNSQLRAGVLEDGKIHMIAHVQEYGATIVAKNAGGYLMIPVPDGTFRKLAKVTIPARPFIAQTVLGHETEWKNEAGKAFHAIVSGGNAEGFKKGLAQKMKNDIVQTMRSGNFAGNAPLTVLIKGSSTPLIDTGGLLGSIQGKVER